MKKKLLIPLALLLLALTVFLTPVRGYAFYFFNEFVSSVGQTVYTDSTTITSQREAGIHTYLVWIQSNAQTVADHVYQVKLYYGESPSPVATLTVSWTAAEIPGTTKLVRFTGLNMTSESNPYVRVLE